MRSNLGFQIARPLNFFKSQFHLWCPARLINFCCWAKLRAMKPLLQLSLATALLETRRPHILFKVMRVGSDTFCDPLIQKIPNFPPLWQGCKATENVYHRGGLLKYGFCKKSLQKNETLTSWTLLLHFCPHFWAWLLLYSAITPKSENKYVVKVFNWSEVHLSEMTVTKSIR